MTRLIDLTPTLEENMSVNSPQHPRAPLVLINQRFEFMRFYYKDVWTSKDERARKGAPPAVDGIPEDWVDPKTMRGWQNEHIILHTHLGAHVDAPLHYNPETKWDAAHIPLDLCYGEAVILDFRHLCEEPYPINVEDLEEAERQAGTRVKQDDIVLIHTGWLKRWGHNREKYGSIPNPGLDVGTEEWFIERKVKLVGGDIANIDYDMTVSCHINWLCREAAGKRPILIAENLANLEKIPTTRFTFCALPLPVVGGSASPVRAIAIVKE